MCLTVVMSRIHVQAWSFSGESPACLSRHVVQKEKKSINRQEGLCSSSLFLPQPWENVCMFFPKSRVKMAGMVVEGNSSRQG